MKTLTRENLSLYLFDDSKSLTITDDNIVVGDPVEFIIGDCNSENTTLHENVVNSPSDWANCKYLFDGTTWTLNPDWVDPDAEPEEDIEEQQP